MLRTTLHVCLLALFLSPGAASASGIPVAMEAAALPAYQVVGDGLAVGGQPAPETLARLKELGFKTVVSLRPEAEGPAEEKDLVDKQGLRFVRVPVTPDTFRAADADAVAAVLDDPKDAPVLLHCSSSNRAGAVLAVLEARKGKSADAAIERGIELGLLKPEMIEAVRRVIAGEAKESAEE